MPMINVVKFRFMKEVPFQPRVEKNGQGPRVLLEVGPRNFSHIYTLYTYIMFPMQIGSDRFHIFYLLRGG
jgi:hypothetical protein